MPSKSRSKTITRDPNWLGPAIAPGEILLEEFLKPLELGQVEAARRLEISLNRLNEIVNGKRGITADTALRLAKLLKTTPEFWMNLQPRGISTMHGDIASEGTVRLLKIKGKNNGIAVGDCTSLLAVAYRR